MPQEKMLNDKFLKPLDIVATPNHSVAMVTDVHDNGDCSITFIYRNPRNTVNDESVDRNAWWSHGELRLLNSLPNLLTEAIHHPFGSWVNPYDIDDR